VFALVDCNNFYVSCERLFNPILKNRPVIVLSNNDGCVVSRSNEVKKLGIPMGIPFFQIADKVRSQGIEVFSSNYALYADISSRIMQVLSNFTTDLEIYSIDEAFLSIKGTTEKQEETEKKALLIRKTVMKHIGIPVSVGIAQTRTLAKFAASSAKKMNSGIFFLKSGQSNNDFLFKHQLEDIWGLGKKSIVHLKRVGVYSISDLLIASDSLVRSAIGLKGLKIKYELNGMSCFSTEDIVSDSRKSISSSLSFSHRVFEKKLLYESFIHHISKALAKLRSEQLYASGISFFVKWVKKENRTLNIYETAFSSLNFNLPQCSNINSDFFVLVNDALEKLYRSRTVYKSSGIRLYGLIGETQHEEKDFFFKKPNPKKKKLLNSIDKLNQLLGKGAVKFASEGIKKNWMMKQNMKSPAYTTSWKDIPVVKA